MTKEQPSDPSVFDVDKVRELVELMEQHELNEIELRQSDRRIKLRRGAPQAQAVGYAPVPVAVPTAAESAPVVDDSKFEFINCPTVGTFYSKPKPESPDFVNVGDIVQPDTVVCLVEAMKMFNEITAGVSGRIVAKLVNNEDAVDVNKPLFKIEPV